MELTIKELPYFDPIMLVANLPEDKDFVFFDSAISLNHKSRFSFIAYDPFAIISCTEERIEVNGKLCNQPPLRALSDQLNLFPARSNRLLPFTGGLAGYLSYECISYIEPKITMSKKDNLGLPNFLFGAFDLIIAFDHLLKQCWVCSSGLPETKESLRTVRAKERCDSLVEIFSRYTKNLSATENIIIETSHIRSNIKYHEYCRAIEKVLTYIEAGNIYQANIAPRFECNLPETSNPIEIYQLLRRNNPAPFAAYIKLKGNIIASFSSERLAMVKDRQVITCPIQGTVSRHSDIKQDKRLAHMLRDCDNNRAQNLMIVDLLRNDLSHICELFSIKASELFSIESYATVHYLVSTIEGKLKEDQDLIDVIRATFPGGSVTGAPKKRAIEIIDEIESHARGPYCGSIGYMGYDGRMDTSVAIRTLVIKDNILTFHVGGGIVADSKPGNKYQEILAEANALYSSLTNNASMLTIQS